MIESAKFAPIADNSLAFLASGSDTIYGSPVDLVLHWTYDSNNQTVSLNLTLQGSSIGSTTLSSSNATASFSGSAGPASASVDVTFDPAGPSLSVTGKVCIDTPFKNICHSVTVNIALT